MSHELAMRDFRGVRQERPRKIVHGLTMALRARQRVCVRCDVCWVSAGHVIQPRARLMPAREGAAGMGTARGIDSEPPHSISEARS